MAPPRSRPPPDDSRSEASSTKEKAGTTSGGAPNGKGRRVTANVAAGSSLRDVVTAGTGGTNVGSSVASTEPKIQWNSFDDSVLHSYRYDYRLQTPAAFKEPYNQIVLSRSAIGRMSPTMARKKQDNNSRRQSKEQLANSVRKHFNSMGIVENDVIVDFLYKARWQDKNFRMRFSPQRPR